MSSVHDPKEAHLHHLHSNHHLAIHNTLNEKLENGVKFLHQSELNLNFYSKIVVDFLSQNFVWSNYYSNPM